MRSVKYLSLSTDYARRHWVHEESLQPVHPDDGAVEALAYAIILGVTWTVVLLVWWLA